MGYWAVARWCSVEGCPNQAIGRIEVEIRGDEHSHPQWHTSHEDYCFCNHHASEALKVVRAPFREHE